MSFCMFVLNKTPSDINDKDHYDFTPSNSSIPLSAATSSKLGRPFNTCITINYGAKLKEFSLFEQEDEGHDYY